MLKVDVLLISGAETRKARALVDTGAAVPIVIRTGLFPSDLLKKSLRPVRFVTANGQELSGGGLGIKAQVCLPVHVGRHRVSEGLCDPLWCYQADLH
jgi:hypothetical protein